MADVIAQDCFARLRFRAEAAIKLTDEEDLTSVEELKELDEKRVDRIVSRIIKPGGAPGWARKCWDSSLRARHP